jgi:hypothetical protein
VVIVFLFPFVECPWWIVPFRSVVLAPIVERVRMEVAPDASREWTLYACLRDRVDPVYFISAKLSDKLAEAKRQSTRTTRARGWNEFEWQQARSPRLRLESHLG